MVGLRSAFLVIFVVSIIQAFPFSGDPCNLNVSPRHSRFSDPDKPLAEYNLTCSSGHISWNYPQGRIRLWFPSTGCLRQGAGSSYVTVYEDRDGMERELIFQQGRACVTNTNGFSMTLQGPRDRTYIATYSYEVLRPDVTLRDRARGLVSHFTSELSRSLENVLNSWRIRFNFGQ